MIYNRAFTDEQIREIRNSYKKGSKDFGIKALAKKWGINESSMSMIVNRVSYQDVE